jgi:dTDP-4-amino-4,6-dideoxygalactose transaminase
MRPDELERKATARTKAVIFVDALGNPSGVVEIKRLCDRLGIPLIEDAACAIGSSVSGRRCGSLADLTCFSFHPRKLICAGEGGAVATSRDDWARWLDVKLNHGASGMKGAGLDFVEYGYNFRMSELQAILGRRQLSDVDAIVEERNIARRSYLELLKPLGFGEQRVGDGVRFNVQSMVVRVPPGCNRDHVIDWLRNRGIEATIGTYALSTTTYMMRRYGCPQPNSRLLQSDTLTLPCYRGVDTGVVADAVRSCLE